MIGEQLQFHLEVLYARRLLDKFQVIIAEQDRLLPLDVRYECAHPVLEGHRIIELTRSRIQLECPVHHIQALFERVPIISADYSPLDAKLFRQVHSLCPVPQCYRDLMPVQFGYE